MNLLSIEQSVRKLLETSSVNRVAADAAIRPDLIAMRMFDEVLLGVASFDDALFEQLRARDIVGPHFMTPGEWLPGAASVISIFFAFTEAVKASNAADLSRPSDEWLHARIEGQYFIEGVMNALKLELEGRGYEAIVPAADERFESAAAAKSGRCGGMPYTSNWSERHAAFVCGLGTFGLSAGLITKIGVAGRFGSLVTSLKLEPTVRRYTEPFEYCTKCGACAVRCPAHAISRESGKDHAACAHFLDEWKKEFAPRYGCGKCQVAVPCQSGAPGSGRI